MKIIDLLGMINPQTLVCVESERHIYYYDGLNSIPLKCNDWEVVEVATKWLFNGGDKAIHIYCVESEGYYEML